MSWLQKKAPINNTFQMSYSISSSKTMLIAGLGNTGSEYNLTRHNAGFIAIDYFVAKNREMSNWNLKKDLKCYFSSGQLGGTRVITAKPTTYMNNSGESIKAIMNYYKLSLNQLFIVHDDIDIKFGQIRIKTGGSSAGHNGIKSISNILGEEYTRIRIGIGPKMPPNIDTADFVLQEFSTSEIQQEENMAKEVNAILNELVFGKTSLETETRHFII